ncbi:MAG: hypothetical protein KME42_13495 [Tildeniella nuda ZEHNDER 1965/U140]|jgi:hypothetical protein|nr:hypothetical protein [Tildeniella nuda ZEHNDER 1965/U140]
MASKPEYRWIPKQEIALDSLGRMQAHFHKPLEPMGEAWFMSEKRRMFHELMEQPIEQVPVKILSKALTEISSGTCCFGHRDEWDQWFKYLLPYSIARCHELVSYDETLLIQDIAAAFMCIYWKGIPEEYPEFREDVICSLSVSLMVSDLWIDYQDELTKSSYPKFNFQIWRNKNDTLRMDWNARKANCNLSSMMFFCLKYLEPKEIYTWIHSCISIYDPYWRGALSVWLLGASDLLCKSIIVPSDVDRAIPQVIWQGSRMLGSIAGSVDAKYPPMEEHNDNIYFLPQEKTVALREEVNRLITPELILDWAELFSHDPFLLESTYSVPESLLEKVPLLPVT